MLDRDALFFYVGWRLRVDVARTLGCRLGDDGSIAIDSGQATTVDRVYAAGNCADPRALVPAAAGSGVTAAVAINARLSFEDADRAVADSRAPAPARRRADPHRRPRATSLESTRAPCGRSRYRRAPDGGDCAGSG
jgi:pyruvate/2-oxoglutarate dehydrogenase complex dihydrolipoamide dehydrogenase (E3) component